MPPEWKKSTNCFRLFIYKSKDLILDINPPNNVFSPYLTLPIMASFFVSGKPIHTLGCVVSEYMCQKKRKIHSILVNSKIRFLFSRLVFESKLPKTLRKHLESCYCCSPNAGADVVPGQIGTSRPLSYYLRS